MGSSSINSALDLLKSWLQSASVTLKVDIHLEEWLQDLLWHVSSTANSLLHLVERVLGSVQKSLIHGPIVVLGQLLDLLSRDGLNMLVQLVGADRLDQIVDGAFHFEVLRPQLLRLDVDPFLLHLDEFIESVGLIIDWQINKNSLGQRLEVVLDAVLHDVVDVDDQLL